MTPALPKSDLRPLAARIVQGVIVVLALAVALGWGLRLLVAPNLGLLKPHLEQVLGQALETPVRIGTLSIAWRGWQPVLTLGTLDVPDGLGGSALRLSRIDVVPRWSVLWGEAAFSHLALSGTTLALTRDASGHLRVGGVSLQDTGDDAPAAALTPGWMRWLAQQGELVARDTTLTWHDALTDAPLLRLPSVNLRVRREGDVIALGLVADDAAPLASALTARARLGWSGGRARPDGELFLDVRQADGAALARYLPMLGELALQGDLRVWLTLADDEVAAVDADLALDRAALRWPEDAAGAWSLGAVRGRVAWRGGERPQLSLDGLSLQDAEGLEVLAPLTASVSVRHDPAGWHDLELSLGALSLAPLSRWLVTQPLPDGMAQALTALQPSGRLMTLEASADGALRAPRRWRIQMQGEQLTWAPYERVPGLQGLSVSLDGNEQGGDFRVEIREGALVAPAVFPEPRIALDRLQASGGWTAVDQGFRVNLARLELQNPDTHGEASGHYDSRIGARGGLDLQARLRDADARSVWRYMPHAVNDDTRRWLRRALEAGTAPEATLRLRGPIDRFPYHDPDEGQFLVKVAVRDARLAYGGDLWPAIEGIAAELRFEGPALHIKAHKGEVMGVAVGPVDAVIPDLEAHGGERLDLVGEANGPTRSFLRFVSQSPVADRINHFTDGMTAEGEGGLVLRLDMPLRKVAETAIDGRFRFGRNRLKVVADLPALEQVSAELRFSESTLSIARGRAELFGEPLSLSADTRDGAVVFEVDGGLRAGRLQGTVAEPLVPHLAGVTDWQATIRLASDETRVELRSALAGVSSSLPAPFNKSAATSWPMTATGVFEGGLARWHVSLGEHLRLRRVTGGAGLGRTALTLDGREPVLPAAGFALQGRTPELDLSAWLTTLRQLAVRRPTATVAEGAEAAPRTAPVTLDLVAGHLTAGMLQLTEARLQLAPSDVANVWQGQVRSPDATIRFSVRQPTDAPLQLSVDADRLALSRATEPAVLPDDAVARAIDAAQSRLGAPSEAPAPETLPELSVTIGSLLLDGRPLGSVRLKTRPRASVWQIESLQVTGTHGTLDAEGRYGVGADGRPDSQIGMTLRSSDVGSLLSGLGYEEVMNRGEGKLEGALSWPGAPWQMSAGQLQGRLTLEIARGRLQQVEPGLGRLLGILSLQALPRRLALDFGDVFAQGFDFDRIAGAFALSEGRMATDDFVMTGPAARVQMYGEVDLAMQTQQIEMQVQPTLSESVAIGAAAAGLLNPVIGVMTYLAQKAMQDPIEQLATLVYEVSGSWSDPVVERVQRLGAMTEGRKDEAR